MNDIATQTRSVDLTPVMALTENDRAAVDALIRARLRSEVVLINQVSEYIIQSGGKRLRPVVHLIAARACGYSGHDHVQLAAVIEFIHTATLLHDDVVDESERRRGRDAAHQVWGNAASVLVGDFLYSRSFQLMVELERMRVMDILADTTNIIAEGEVLQLMHLGNSGLSEADYRHVIYCKTACLFEAAGRLGAVLAGADEAVERALADYGRNLGMAFQIADDLLDYRADAGDLGKNLGDDLAEGKVTLPLILALETAGDSDRACLREIIAEGGTRDLERVMAILDDSGALETAAERARALAADAEQCLESLPDSDEKNALSTLAGYAVARTC